MQRHTLDMAILLFLCALLRAATIIAAPSSYSNLAVGRTALRQELSERFSVRSTEPRLDSRQPADNTDNIEPDSTTGTTPAVPPAIAADLLQIGYPLSVDRTRQGGRGSGQAGIFINNRVSSGTDYYVRLNSQFSLFLHAGEDPILDANAMDLAILDVQFQLNKHKHDAFLQAVVSKFHRIHGPQDIFAKVAPNGPNKLLQDTASKLLEKAQLFITKNSIFRPLAFVITKNDLNIMEGTINTRPVSEPSDATGQEEVYVAPNGIPPDDLSTKGKWQTNDAVSPDDLSTNGTWQTSEAVSPNDILTLKAKLMPYKFDETPFEISIIADEDRPMSGLAIDFAVAGLQLGLWKAPDKALDHEIVYTSQPRNIRISIAPASITPPTWLTYGTANSLLELMLKDIDSEAIYFEQKYLMSRDNDIAIWGQILPEIRQKE